MTFLHDHGEPYAHRLRELTIATVAALAVFGGLVSIAHTIQTASADAVHSEMAAPKTDRAASALPAECHGQSWGNWSTGCATALSGNRTMRQVQFTTVETRQPGANTSVLERIPSSS